MQLSSKLLRLIPYVIILVTGFNLLVHAQDKQLTFNQVYLFGQPRLLKPLPQLRGWYDDEHYIQSKNENGKAYCLLLMHQQVKKKLFLITPSTMMYCLNMI